MVRDLPTDVVSVIFFAELLNSGCAAALGSSGVGSRLRSPGGQQPEDLAMSVTLELLLLCFCGPSGAQQVLAMEENRDAARATLKGVRSLTCSHRSLPFMLCRCDGCQRHHEALSCHKAEARERERERERELWPCMGADLRNGRDTGLEALGRSEQKTSNERTWGCAWPVSRARTGKCEVL